MSYLSFENEKHFKLVNFLFIVTSLHEKHDFKNKLYKLLFVKYINWIISIIWEIKCNRVRTNDRNSLLLKVVVYLQNFRNRASHDLISGLVRITFEALRAILIMILQKDWKEKNYAYDLLGLENTFFTFTFVRRFQTVFDTKLFHIKKNRDSNKNKTENLQMDLFDYVNPTLS